MPSALSNLLEQARPAGTVTRRPAALLAELRSSERAHEPRRRESTCPPSSWSRVDRRWSGFVLATAFYGLARARIPTRSGSSSPPIYRLLWNKWYFDELYDVHVRSAGAVRLAAAWPISIAT